MQIQTANLIPKEDLEKQNYLEKGRKVTSILIATIITLLLLTSIISGFSYYLKTNKDMDVPSTIKNEYMTAQKNTELLAKKKDLFVMAKNEDSLVIETLLTLLSAKPNDIKLTRFEIVNTNSIQIEGFGNDLASFNQYVSQINGQSNLFSKAVVEKITETTGNVKTFIIKVERIKK